MEKCEDAWRELKYFQVSVFVSSVGYWIPKAFNWSTDKISSVHKQNILLGIIESCHSWNMHIATFKFTVH